MASWRQLILGVSFLLAGAAQANPLDLWLEQTLRPQMKVPQLEELDDGAMPRAVVRFYEDRQWRAVWDQPRYETLLKQLADLQNDGLNPADYELERLRALASAGSSDTESLLERELLATRAYLMALLNLYRGKVDPMRLDAHWSFDMRQLDPEQGLQMAREAVETDLIPQIFQKARPSMPQYTALRTALIRYRKILDQHNGWPRLPVGKPLRPGMSHPDIARLRERLRIVGLLPARASGKPGYYDPALTRAVERFQRGAGLPVTGIAGPETLRELSVPIDARMGQLRANLERLRWLMRTTRDRAVIIDLAGSRVLFMQSDVVAWESPAQLGRLIRQTPMAQSAITRITLNPSWNLPSTALYEEVLPAIRGDKDYLTRNRIRVYAADGSELSPADVNWKNPGDIALRQEGGAGNAQGQITIRFPNDQSIYLHGQALLRSRDAGLNTLGSTAVRVENIQELAVLLLDNTAIWSPQILTSALTDPKTRHIALSRPAPVLLAYWTANVDNDGYVSFRPDNSGQDALTLNALDGRWSEIARQ